MGITRIIYTGGGCCDCGDETAWKREGFCSKHKGAEQIQPLPDEIGNSVGPVLDALFLCWRDELLAAETISREDTSVTNLGSRRRKASIELTHVVEMLLDFCINSESLLSFVSKRMISTVGLISLLVRAERFLSIDVTKKLHELLLKLIGKRSPGCTIGRLGRNSSFLLCRGWLLADVVQLRRHEELFSPSGVARVLQKNPGNATPNVGVFVPVDVLMCYARFGAIALPSMHEYSGDINKGPLTVLLPKAGRWYVTIAPVNLTKEFDGVQDSIMRVCYSLAWRVAECPFRKAGINCI